MAQKYVVVERKNPLKPQEAAKFYAMARSNRRVDTDEVISRVSERSSYSIGELKGCITEFLLEMKNQLALGNIVLLGDMGSFRVTIATGNATETAEKFKAATCIKTSRVRFRPGNMLLDMCKAMKYTLVKKGESDEAVVPDPDEKPDNGNGGGGNPDDGNPSLSARRGNRGDGRFKQGIHQKLSFHWAYTLFSTKNGTRRVSGSGKCGESRRFYC